MTYNPNKQPAAAGISEAQDTSASKAVVSIEKRGDSQAPFVRLRRSLAARHAMRWTAIVAFAETSMHGMSREALPSAWVYEIGATALAATTWAAHRKFESVGIARREAKQDSIREKLGERVDLVQHPRYGSILYWPAVRDQKAGILRIGVFRETFYERYKRVVEFAQEQGIKHVASEKSNFDMFTIDGRNIKPLVSEYSVDCGAYGTTTDRHHLYHRKEEDYQRHIMTPEVEVIVADMHQAAKFIYDVETNKKASALREVVSSLRTARHEHPFVKQYATWERKGQPKAMVPLLRRTLAMSVERFMSNATSNVVTTDAEGSKVYSKAHTHATIVGGQVRMMNEYTDAAGESRISFEGSASLFSYFGARNREELLVMAENPRQFPMPRDRRIALLETAALILLKNDEKRKSRTSKKATDDHRTHDVPTTFERMKKVRRIRYTEKRRQSQLEKEGIAYSGKSLKGRLGAAAVAGGIVVTAAMAGGILNHQKHDSERMAVAKNIDKTVATAGVEALIKLGLIPQAEYEGYDVGNVDLKLDELTKYKFPYRADNAGIGDVELGNVADWHIRSNGSPVPTDGYWAMNTFSDIRLGGRGSTPPYKNYSLEYQMNPESANLRFVPLSADSAKPGHIAVSGDRPIFQNVYIPEKTPSGATAAAEFGYDLPVLSGADVVSAGAAVYDLGTDKFLEHAKVEVVQRPDGTFAMLVKTSGGTHKRRVHITYTIDPKATTDLPVRAASKARIDGAPLTWGMRSVDRAAMTSQLRLPDGRTPTTAKEIAHAIRTGKQYSYTPFQDSGIKAEKSLDDSRGRASLTFIRTIGRVVAGMSNQNCNTTATAVMLGSGGVGPNGENINVATGYRNDGDDVLSSAEAHMWTMQDETLIDGTPVDPNATASTGEPEEPEIVGSNLDTVTSTALNVAKGVIALALFGAVVSRRRDVVRMASIIARKRSERVQYANKLRLGVLESELGVVDNPSSSPEPIADAEKKESNQDVTTIADYILWLTFTNPGTPFQPSGSQSAWKDRLNSLPTDTKALRKAIAAHKAAGSFTNDKEIEQAIIALSKLLEKHGKLK